MFRSISRGLRGDKRKLNVTKVTVFNSERQNPIMSPLNKYIKERHLGFNNLKERHFGFNKHMWSVFVLASSFRLFCEPFCLSLSRNS